MWPFAGKVWTIWCVMMYKIRNVTSADLRQVTQLEAACFPPAEAAGERAFAYRIASFPERFFVAEADGSIIGMVNGCASDLPLIADSLFESQGHDPKGKNQMVFGLAVHPKWQRRGIGSALMHRLIEFSTQNHLQQVILTCKAEKITYYERFGFQNCGISQSTHGDAVWYDMILRL